MSNISPERIAYLDKFSDDDLMQMCKPEGRAGGDGYGPIEHATKEEWDAVFAMRVERAGAYWAEHPECKGSCELHCTCTLRT